VARRLLASLALAALIAGVAPAIALATVDNGGRVDRTVQQVQWGTAAGCRTPLREAPDPSAPEACAAIDGRPVSETQMKTYESSWVHRALSLQRGLDDAAPLAEEQLPHTHNSFNASSYKLGSTSYYPTLTNQDPNQVYSLTDQLRMDIRAVEIDVHWVPSPYGNASTGGKWVTMCHGSGMDPTGTGTYVHVGCTWDRPLQDGLAEVATWLHAHPDAFILLYLENQLYSSDAADKTLAHNTAAGIIADKLGDLVYRPPALPPGQCTNMPLGASRAQMRDSADPARPRQVLLVGNCGPGAWGSWVHERGPLWDEHGDPSAYDDNACKADQQARQTDTSFRRSFEDSTWLANMQNGKNSLTTPATAARMVACGVNIVGLDQLTPTDPRLPALVWSWAQDEPRAGAGDCAYQGPDTRFHAGDCKDKHRFSCVDATGGWHVTSATGQWDKGAKACAREFAGSRFAVPANGYRNQVLATAKGGGDAWVNYAAVNGNWTANP
jgi:hypothetical protein